MSWHHQWYIPFYFHSPSFHKPLSYIPITRQLTCNTWTSGSKRIFYKRFCQAIFSLRFTKKFGWLLVIFSFSFRNVTDSHRINPILTEPEFWGILLRFTKYFSHSLENAKKSIEFMLPHMYQEIPSHLSVKFSQSTKAKNFFAILSWTNDR